jgi:hypothetical protein
MIQVANNTAKLIRNIVLGLLIFGAGFWIVRHFYQARVYEQIIHRLEAETRAADVLVTGVNYEETTRHNVTTIKFVEYDTKGSALSPKYFTFSGNLIQFQSLVVRFDDRFVVAGDRLKGKSVYLFWKVFSLDAQKTQEFPITQLDEVPDGYKIEGRSNSYEKGFWREFWKYAFDPQKAERAGVKSVQIEAPGSVFIPGYLYTIVIEHDGGLRIDTRPLPDIIRGEKIL